MSKKQTPRRRKAAAFFTTDERDAINHAKSNLRGLITILLRVSETVSESPMELSGDDTENAEAFGVLCDGLRDNINAIDEAFHAADERQGGDA